MFPEALRFSLSEPINQAIDWIVVQYGESFENFSDFLLKILIFFEDVLRDTPWWLFLSIVFCLTYFISRKWTLSSFLVGLFFLIGVLGLWDKAMQSLSLMLVATGFSIVIGIPFGVLLSRSEKLRKVCLPMLDVMQTMPSFVYLIPALMLFGLGKVPAIFATMIYALPPLIRLTDLGIRLVDKDVLEAAKAFGVSKGEKLWGIELPLAFPNIMAGINQTTMMALSMVVIASMIGARGLGEQVLLGIQRLDVGKGTEAGLAIVAIAVILDRFTQSLGKKIKASYS
ncbi:MAG: proline/glycine betaine ABC transporter permease [Oligoflexales bacterium]|nr:proline/glycine betaine ABC transporter permease [Oligoflexales bacterium]